MQYPVPVTMLYHIHMQCEIVLEANRDLDATIAAYANEFEEMRRVAADPNREWRPLGPKGTATAYRHLQSMLVAAANISKALWGVKNTKSDVEKEREPLRAALGVSDTSILKNRSVRDCFEHYDERVVDWIVKHSGSSFSDCNIGNGLPPGKVFRHYNHAKKVVSGVGRDFAEFHLSITDLVTEVERLVTNNPFAPKPPPPPIDYDALMKAIEAGVTKKPDDGTESSRISPH